MPVAKKPRGSLGHACPSTRAVNGRSTRSATWRGPSAVCTQVSAVTQGFVAAIVSAYQRLFFWLMRSMKITPGSAAS
ncbi:MAG: hypothetical protein U5L06_10875 [Rhodovibrio sp.]|nr:hypothetical protein [Rhodovibrio sp.]